MNIVILLAGKGSRFKDYSSVPKPLINIDDVTMLEMAISSLGLKGNLIFIKRKYEVKKYNEMLDVILRKYTTDENIITLEKITEGAAQTALMAKNIINTKQKLIITNCDQILHWDSDEFINFISNNESDAIVVTYNTNTPKNSYVKINELGFATEFAEKKVISNHSLNGIHYWKHGSDFVESAEKMIEKNIRVNNEFYISMTFNEMIEMKKRISIYPLKAGMHYHVGTPEDLHDYLGRKK